MNCFSSGTLLTWSDQLHTPTANGSMLMRRLREERFSGEVWKVSRHCVAVFFLLGAVIHHRFCFSAFLLFLFPRLGSDLTSSLAVRNEDKQTKAAINRRTPNKKTKSRHGVAGCFPERRKDRHGVAGYFQARRFARQSRARGRL